MLTKCWRPGLVPSFTVRELVGAPESGVRVNVPFPLVFAFQSVAVTFLRTAVGGAVRPGVVLLIRRRTVVRRGGRREGTGQAGNVTY